VVAVFFTIINLFIYFSRDDSTPRPTFNKYQESKHRALYAKFKVSKYSKDDVIVNDIHRLVACKTTGYYCTDNYRDVEKDFHKSYLGLTAGLLTAPYAHPPASGMYYVYDSLKNADFIPSAYAAEGIGFAGIKPLLKIWKQFRNIAYLVLVIILVVIGFMIMFRMKLDPHTVIGIENALPRIVVTLILITFSFPIAGFMIDFMYMLIALIIIGIGNVSGIPQLNPDALIGKYFQASPSDIPGLLSGVNGWGFANVWDMFETLPDALIGLFGATFQNTTRVIGSLLAVYFVWGRFFGMWDKTFGNVLDASPEGELTSGIGAALHLRLDGMMKGFANTSGAFITLLLTVGVGFFIFHKVVLGLLIFFTLIFLSFRIFFMLFSSYLKILILVIISPLLIMFEAIPGKSAFSSWFKSLFTELLTFPLLIGIFILGTIIFEVAASGELMRLPFFWQIDSGAFSVILGMGFLFMTPDFIKVAKKLLIREPLPLPDIGPGVFFGGATSAIGSGTKQLSQYASMFHYIKPLQGVLGKVIGGDRVDALFGNQPGTHGRPKS